MSNSSFLKFGDMICLYSDFADGYLSTIGHNHPNFIVQITANQTMATIPNQRSMIFEVHPKLTYNVSNGYNKILLKKHKQQQLPDPDQDQIYRLQNELKVQAPRRQVEINNNKNVVKNSRGDPIMYGMNVQLQHVQSGQYIVMSTKSAEQDKTCQKLELSDQPSASRVTFQIQPRYRYRQEGDKVVYMDQILLYNVKNNAYVHFSQDLMMPASPDESVQSEFRPKSPKRRRNPENLFSWYEANVSQNFQKWQIISYRQTDDPIPTEFELHGGDVVRLKHAESGGYITVDDQCQERNGLQEAYVRVYHGLDEIEEQTTNQLFELESPIESMDATGDVLSWMDEPETGKQLCRVHLRHFNSGRLLQVTYFKDQSNLGQVVTLADCHQLEEDGANIFGKKILTKGGKLQNFIFNLFSRSMVNDTVRTLSKESVCNLGNAGTKLYLSTQLFSASGADDEEEEDEEIIETEEQRKQREFETDLTLAQRDKKKKSQSQLKEIRQIFEKNKEYHQIEIKTKHKEGTGAKEIKLTNNNRVFRQTKSGENDAIIQNNLTLKTKGSMNDVFLPIKSGIQQLRDVSFIHSAVPRIKLYLCNLRKKAQDLLNLPFFISLMELLRGIIYWVLEIDMDNFQDPFKCEGFPNKFRQKVLRETRLLDLLIDCLIYPFETGLFAYDDLTQQHPITRICQLVYRILKHSVKECNINKNYVAQWIDLFFKQAMVTTEKNSFLAEKTITELLSNNKQLLDTQIETSTIVSLIDLCLRQPKHERFLNLLSHLCSCDGQAISSNQDGIYATVLENESNKKGMLFTINTKDRVHYVNILDNGVAPTALLKIPMEEMYAYFLEKRDLRLYNYFQSLIDLMASICMERNYKCINQLVNIYTLDMVIDCTLDDNIPYAMRARFARLLITLHMDKDPLEKLNIPIMTRVWDEIEAEEIVLPHSLNIPKQLLELKPAFEKFLRETNGICRVYEADFNLFLLEALKIIETMIALGFYTSESEIVTIVRCLITLLDGSLDFYDPYEEKQLAMQLQESGSNEAYQPLIKTKDMHNIRYKKTLENEGMMAIKNKIIDICVTIMDIQDNKRLSIFLIQFQQFDKRITPGQSKYLQLMMKINQAGSAKKFERQISMMGDAIKDTCTELNQWVVTSFAEKNLDLVKIAQQDFIAILLDLNLYENPDLVANAFKLLVRYFTQKSQILNLASEVQVLQDAEEIAVLQQCSEALRQMKKDAESSEFWMGDEKVESLKMSRSFIDRLAALTDLNVYRENRVIDLGNKKAQKKKRKTDVDDDAAFQFLNLSEFNQQWDDEDKRILTDYDVFDEQNQRLLRNLRAYDISVQIIKQKSLKQSENKNAYLKVVEKAYIFLIKFVKDNKENQNIVLDYIDFFLDDIELGVHALELITEIFRDSESLLTYPLVPLIKKIASDIDFLDIETTKKATLLSFVPVFMFYKDQCLKDNQFLILNEFTSQARKNSNFLFVGPDGHDELRIYMAEMKQQYLEFMSDEKLMAEIDVPPEVSYTINYIQLVAYASQGKNASCETRAQAVFSVQDVITNMKIADFCYPFKSALMFFLQNVYFDIEKEVTEDFTKVVWQVLEIVVEDMLKFTEVMQRSKRAAGGVGGGAPTRGQTLNVSQDQPKETAEEEQNQFDNTFNALTTLKVDANKFFTFTTAFGKFPVSELMQKYVFEGVFPSLEAFLNLRLPMKEKEQMLVSKLLKLLYLSVPYKSKPIHDRNIQQFVRSVRSIPALQELGGDVNLASLGISDGEDTGQKIAKMVAISQAQKLKIFMKMTRSDNDLKAQLVKEFEQLVMSIIFIPKKTNEAFKGANTIAVKDFICSLIQSTDVTSDIPTPLRTQSLKIIRKVIESENKNCTTSAMEWSNDDWAPFKVLIEDAQNMLCKMNVVTLLCRIISQEVRRDIKEEGLLVCVGLLLGGNEISQNKFCEFMQNDNENVFCRAIYDQLQECFEIIKKNQIKRNVKCAKIISIDTTLEEMQERNVEEDDEDLMKLQEQRKALEDEIKDTEYITDELRDGEEMTVSRAIENIIVILRFLQLLCENHNIDLQKMLCVQTNIEGRPKPKSVNIINQLARIIEQMQKIINSVTCGVGHQLVDTIIEVIQGPCKDNQRTLVNAKILDTCRELINMLSKKENLIPLGFVSDGRGDSDSGDEEEDLMEVLDEFISKIATMLVSLLEGESDFEILQKMAFSLSIEDMKERLVNVFGVFLHKLKLYPVNLLELGQSPESTPLNQLSKARDHNCLANVSINKIKLRMKRDSFEGNISEAFDIFILLQNLAEGVPACANYILKDSYTADQWKVFEFLRQNTGMIEVSVYGKLQAVYFPIRPVCDFISEKTSKKVMNDVRRESQQTKVQDLMEWTPQLIDEMRHVESLQSATIQITPTLMSQLKDFSNFVGLIISLAQLFFLQRVRNYRDPYVPEYISLIIFILGIVQGSSSGILIVFYAINKYALVTKAGWRNENKQNKLNGVLLMDNEQRLNVNEMSVEQTHLILMVKGPEADEFNLSKGKRNFGNHFTKIESDLYNVYFFLQDKTFQYYVLYFGISFLGFFSNELFYSFHLLDVIQRYPTLSNVTKAITMNQEQLIMTFALMLIVMYIYTTISFFYIMETLYDYKINNSDSDLVGENRCESMIKCYMTVVNYGLLLGGGYGDYTEQQNYSENPQKFFIVFLIDVSFFLLVKIILYNILFGIIIDTFAQLREQKNFMETDKNNQCFICHFERFTFDKECEGGFTRHISKDHNLWQYVYYIVHLQSKDSSEYTGIESYVSFQYQYQNIQWLPRQKALCLEKLSQVVDEDEEMTHVREEVKSKSELIGQITQRLQKLEAKVVAARKKQE